MDSTSAVGEARRVDTAAPEQQLEHQDNEPTTKRAKYENTAGDVSAQPVSATQNHEASGEDLAIPAKWAKLGEKSPMLVQAVKAETIQDVSLMAAVRRATEFLVAQKSSRPKTIAKLKGELERKALPKRSFSINPLKLAEALGTSVTAPQEMLARLRTGLRAPIPDPLNIFGAPGGDDGLPSACLSRIRRDLARLQKAGTLPAEQQAEWLLSQAYRPAGIDVQAVIDCLIANGFLQVVAGRVEYTLPEQQQMQHSRQSSTKGTGQGKAAQPAAPPAGNASGAAAVVAAVPAAAAAAFAYQKPWPLDKEPVPIKKMKLVEHTCVALLPPRRLWRRLAHLSGGPGLAQKEEVPDLFPWSLLLPAFVPKNKLRDAAAELCKAMSLQQPFTMSVSSYPCCTASQRGRKTGAGTKQSVRGARPVPRGSRQVKRCKGKVTPGSGARRRVGRRTGGAGAAAAVPESRPGRGFVMAAQVVPEAQPAFPIAGQLNVKAVSQKPLRRLRAALADHVPQSKLQASSCMELRASACRNRRPPPPGVPFSGAVRGPATAARLLQFKVQHVFLLKRQGRGWCVDAAIPLAGIQEAVSPAVRIGSSLGLKKCDLRVPDFSIGARMSPSALSDFFVKGGQARRRRSSSSSSTSSSRTRSRGSPSYSPCRYRSRSRDRTRRYRSRSRGRTRRYRSRSRGRTRRFRSRSRDRTRRSRSTGLRSPSLRDRSRSRDHTRDWHGDSHGKHVRGSARHLDCYRSCTRSFECSGDRLCDHIDEIPRSDTRLLDAYRSCNRSYDRAGDSLPFFQDQSGPCVRAHERAWSRRNRCE